MNYCPSAKSGINRDVLSVLIHLLWAASCTVHAVNVKTPTFLAEFTVNKNNPKEELYTQNQVCQQNNCINPLFPGLNDLPRLEMLSWSCTSYRSVQSELDFCKSAVNYDVALPQFDSAALGKAVKTQDDAASTMFFYHLSSLNYEVWEHADPAHSSDTCVQSIWKLACYTYLPKCVSKNSAFYHRPCARSCEEYLKVCNVECCDESPRCLFQHVTNTSGRQQLIQSGYAESTSECTERIDSHNDMYDALHSSQNAGHRLHIPFALFFCILWIHLIGHSAGTDVSPDSPVPQKMIAGGIGKSILAVVLALCAISMHGCSADPHHHSTGNWESQEDYLMKFEVIPPGQLPSAAQLNSCRIKDLPSAEQCSGRGYCQAWDEFSFRQNAVSFCVCDRYWTDPECRTRRKSQTASFVLSLFGGMFGVDYFYLGYHGWAIFKLFTLGGLGLWWLVDIVRTGSGPVFARDHRVAEDLAHWVFVLSTIAFFMMIGFGCSMWSYFSYRFEKRARTMGSVCKPMDMPLDTWGGAMNEGYGATIGGAPP